MLFIRMMYICIRYFTPQNCTPQNCTHVELTYMRSSSYVRAYISDVRYWILRVGIFFDMIIALNVRFGIDIDILNIYSYIYIFKI